LDTCEIRSQEKDVKIGGVIQIASSNGQRKPKDALFLDQTKFIKKSSDEKTNSGHQMTGTYKLFVHGWVILRAKSCWAKFTRESRTVACGQKLGSKLTMCRQKNAGNLRSNGQKKRRGKWGTRLNSWRTRFQEEKAGAA